MKRIRKLIVLTIVLTILLLTSCHQQPPQGGQSASSTPGPSNASMASGSPESPPAASASAEAPSPAPTDWHSGVKTDYSGLTPYKPLPEKYTRLSAGPLPTLTPSEKYGKLLPYVGESLYGESGYNSFNRFGFITEDAVIVTDPIYTNASQGSYYNYGEYASYDVRAYDLEKIADKIDKNNPWNSILHAVCALDGSWITKFDYKGVYFTDKIIMCIRDSEKNDVDIFDYSGKLLYNTTALDCYKDIPPQSAYALESGYGDGLIAIPLSTGKTAYVDALSGDVTLANYALGEAFFGGYARVRQTENGLTGFINQNFELVIPMQYSYADYFNNGKSIVQLGNDGFAVIDTTGKVLFKNQYSISRWDKDTYSVSEAKNNVRFYDSNFVEITVGSQPLTPLYDGWFYYSTNRGVVVIKGSEKYALPGVRQVNTVAAGLVVYSENNKDSWSEGVKTLSGETVVPLTANISPSIVTDSKSGTVYIIVSSWSMNGADPSFTVMTKDGATILSGKGYAYYDEKNNLFQVNDIMSYGYVDMTGNYIFRISLMQYVPD